MPNITIGLLFLIIIELNSFPLKSNIRSDSLNVPKGVFQFMVSLQLYHNRLHICGAALITKRNAISAAHCSDYKGYVSYLTDHGPEKLNYGVAIGSHSINPGGEWHHVLRFMYPDKYSHESNPYSRYDIAAIHFENAVQTKTRIGFYLPHLNKETRGRVSGWGVGKSCLGAVSQTLRWTSFHVVNNSFCEEAYNIKLEDQFCGQSDNEDEYLVQGDDGGVFTPIENYNKYAGIVSNVQYGSKYIVFTNVYNRLKFIMAAVRQTFGLHNSSTTQSFVNLYMQKYPEYT